MMHCCSVDEHKPWIGLYANGSTSLHGGRQPGAPMFGDCVSKNNTRALQVAPEMLSTPERHDRVAEVVFLDPTKEVYSIVGEVKGDPQTSRRAEH